MRNYFWHLKWLGVCAAAVGLATETGLGGDDPGTGIYFRGGMGPALAQRTDVLEVFGPVSGVKVKYDPGLRLSVAGGYHFCSYFSAELESGIIYNTIDSISGSPEPDASLANVPLLCNAVFHLPLESKFTPYCGVGAGGSSSVLDINHATIAGVSLHGDDAVMVWAVQAFAGFRYEFNDHMAVGAGYKFLATGEPEWDAISAGGSGRIRFDKARTHALLAEFTMRF
jgi:opacity protein-like surface antigen